MSGNFSRQPVFAQIMNPLDPTEFARCAERFPMRRAPRGFSAYDHFLTMVFAHLTHRESLRDLAACLQTRRAYHAGFRSRATRTNIAYANRHRDWRVFAAVAEVLMRRVRRVYEKEPQALELPEVCYALDASMIHLSLAVFPWAHWQTKAAAVKLHTLLSLRTLAPSWITVTEACFPDQKSLDLVPVEAGAFYVMDRGYLDFPRLARWHQAGAYFVVRSLDNVSFRVISSSPVDKSSSLRCDQLIRLRRFQSKRAYPHVLRRIRIYDQEHQQQLVVLSNHLKLPASVVALLYRKRWQVELFFKWIKQHLKLRVFLGRTQNAVRCQVWAAVCAYLLVILTKKRFALNHSLHRILQTVSISPFEQIPLSEVLAEMPKDEPDTSSLNQLSLNVL
jgi:IS4 transposase